MKYMPKILSSPKWYQPFQKLLKGRLHWADLKTYVAGPCILSDAYNLQFFQFYTLSSFAWSNLN